MELEKPIRIVSRAMHPMLRKEAVVFHRDPLQTLIPAHISPGNIFGSTGDLGDCVAMLPALRQLGGGKIVLFYRNGGQRESLRGARYDFIAPLLAAQPYVTGVEWSESQPTLTHDCSSFRSRWNGLSLAHWQARHIGVTDLDVSPWLTVAKSERSKGRIVVARSPRYHNPCWNPVWQKIARKYGKQLLFVGLPDEHKAFEAVTGKVEYAPVKTALELASLIAGADWFAGNQSLALWLAMGLGQKLVCEVFPAEPNSTLPRPGSHFVKTAADIRLFMAGG